MKSVSKQIIDYLLDHGYELNEKKCSHKYRAFTKAAPYNDTGMYIFVGTHGGLRAGYSQSNSWAWRPQWYKRGEHLIEHSTNKAK